MNTFNKKSLYAAIAGLGALGAVGTAEAVHVNPDGLGQVLIYPYYTARTRTTGTFAGSTYNTLISVVNSTASAKAVKVRFLESLDSREVLDFNLYLSAHDVWTTGVVPTAAGAGIVTGDVSCTDPKIAPLGSAPSAFLNYQYTGKNADGADTSLDRTREGYVEIIEMANINDATATWSAVTHSKGSGGTPTCSGIAASGTDYTTGNGGLFGSLTIINVAATAETATDPTALENWVTAKVNITTTGSISPDLSSGDVFTSETFKQGLVITSTWGTTIDAVSASLMHDSIMNEYILDAGTVSGTDWIVTYPTKRFYNVFGPGSGIPPFQSNFDGKACDEVGIAFWDREERVPATSSGGFSPPPPGNPASSLCYEANVVTFNKSNVFASPVSANIDVGTFQNGWALLDLVARVDVAPPYHQLTSGANTYNGLPVIGFATATFFNGSLPTVCNAVPPATCPVTQSAYGGSYKHKATNN